jgi:Electron transfer DM13
MCFALMLSCKVDYTCYSGAVNNTIKVLVGVGAIALLVISYYAISPLWKNVLLEEVAPASTVPLIAARPIIDTPAHPASGVVSVLENSDGMILRYENFKTINGPDLRVYLSTDLEATQFVDLGELKATEGSVNYQIPEGTDLQKYRYALVWCEDFSVLFNSADLQP